MIKNKLCNSNELNENETSICVLAKEIIMTKELNDLNVNGFDNVMLDFVLNEICVN